MRATSAWARSALPVSARDRARQVRSLISVSGSGIGRANAVSASVTFVNATALGRPRLTAKSWAAGSGFCFGFGQRAELPFQLRQEAVYALEAGLAGRGAAHQLRQPAQPRGLLANFQHGGRIPRQPGTVAGTGVRSRALEHQAQALRQLHVAPGPGSRPAFHLLLPLGKAGARSHAIAGGVDLERLVGPAGPAHGQALFAPEQQHPAVHPAAKRN